MLPHYSALKVAEQFRVLEAIAPGRIDLGVGRAPGSDGLTAHAPELWVLGSSNYGAQLAAHLGLPYAYAYFFVDGAGADEALALYRRQYKPSGIKLDPAISFCPFGSRLWI